jgi:hypothetical protein
LKSDAPEEIVEFGIGRLELAQNPAAVLDWTAPERGVDDLIIVPVEVLDNILPKNIYPKAGIYILILAHKFLPFCIFYYKNNICTSLPKMLISRRM